MIVQVDDETDQKIDKLAKELGVTRSDVVFLAVRNLKDDWDENTCNWKELLEKKYRKG